MGRNDAVDIQDMCKKLRPMLGGKIDKLFLEYSIADSQEKKHEIFQIIIALYSKYVDEKILENNVQLEPPKDGIVAGKYELGKINYPNKAVQSFGLRDQDWVRHVCVSGMSGSGKTTLAIRILSNFIKEQKPFIVFDWKKSFRQLLSLSNKLVYFTVGKPKVSNFFRFNVNKPPDGVSLDEWITVLADLLCEVYGASFGVHKLLTEVLQKAYRDFGAYAGSENYPTWFQIKDRLEKMENSSKGHSRQAEWLTSTLRIVHSLTFGEFGQTINDKNKHNLSMEELLENQVVFELDGLGVMEKKFFCSYILLYIYKLKKAKSSGETSGFKSAILVDEAHNIFLKERPSFIQESVTDQIYREIREYGVSLICLDQHISKLSDTVLGNSSVNIAFQQILPQDVEAISRLMFLNDNKSIFAKLEVGQAIVKLTERSYDPFIINVEIVNIKKRSVDDQTLRNFVKEHCLYKKRLKLSKEMMKDEELAKQLNRLKNAIHSSGADISEGDVKKQILIKQDLDNALKEEQNPDKKRTVLLNHLQEEIFENIKNKIKLNTTLKDIKDEFLNEGCKSSDVNRAFKAFCETKEGSVIMKFLELFDSHVKKSGAQITNLNPLEALHFLQKLQMVDENLTVTQLYKELDYSSRKGNDIKNALVDLKLIKIVEEKHDKGMRKKLNFTSNSTKLLNKIE